MTIAAADNLVFTHDYIFHTIQGEGKFIGVPSVFVRLSGCNLRCQWQNADGSTTLCDTAYSSHHPESKVATVVETVAAIHAYGCHHVVVTGGEPLLQSGTPILIAQLAKLGHHVTIETNGTLYVPTQAQFLSISPKLHSAVAQSYSSSLADQHQPASPINLTALTMLTTNQEHQLKFVVHERADLDEIATIVAQLREIKGGYDEGNIVLMPQGSSVGELDRRIPWIVESCKERGWRFSDRLHIRLWGSRRGI